MDKAFNNHIEVNSDIPPNVLLFAFETGPMSWEPMQQMCFMEHYDEIWLDKVHAPLMGHSFCIRGMTHLLPLGMDLFIMMVQGHWNSDAFLAYCYIP